MMIKKGLYFFLLLIHLQATAGELIKIENIATMRPAIIVGINEEQAKLLAGNMNHASNLLNLYMIISDTPATVPVSGSYTITGRELSFLPTYTLGDGKEFEVQYRTGGQPVTKRFIMPSKPKPTATASVITAYPRVDTVPYNTLFFHVRFSEPMLEDKDAYHYVKVYDEHGAERERAWRQKSFWLDSNKVLVLMIHPGRVKTGIHYEGPLFDSGRRYTIKVDTGIRDVNGQALNVAYTQQYYVGGEDRTCPKAEIAHKLLPKDKTREPILLSFSEYMDHASVTEGTNIYDHTGKHIPCIVSALADDSHYQVMPLQKWQKGKYTLVLKSAVYDIAANRIGRPFETTSIEELEKGELNTEFTFTIE